MKFQFRKTRVPEIGDKGNASVMKNLDLGSKLTREFIFQRCILKPKVLNEDHSPLKIDPHRGVLIMKPVLNSTANKHKLFK